MNTSSTPSLRRQASDHQQTARRRPFLAALGLGLTLALAPGSRAANDAYSTDAASGVFSSSFTLNTATPTAGGTASPASGDSLYFGAAATPTVSNDLTGPTFGGLTFNAGAAAFTISGNAFTLASGGTVADNAAAMETINNAIGFGTGTTAAAITTVANGGLTFGGTLTGSAPLTLSGGGTVTFSSTATSSNATGLVTVNSGLLVLAHFGTAATKYNAIGGSGLTLAGGTVQISTASGLGNYEINSNVAPTINSGTLDLNGTTQYLGGLAGTGGMVTSTSATATTVQVGNSIPTNFSYGGVIADGGAAVSLSKNNTNLQTLTGASTYTGTTAISGGTLAVSSLNSITTNAVLGTVHSASSALGAPTSATNGTIGIGTGGTGGQLTYLGTGETTDRVIKMSGTTGGVTLDQSGTGALKFVSNFTATGAGVKTLTLQGSTAGTGEIAGAIPNNSATNTTGVTKAGTGQWTLSGAESYTGTTSVTGGTLSLARAGTAAGTGGTLTGASPLSVTGGTLLLSANDTVGTANTVGLGGGGLSAANGVLTGRGATIAGGTVGGGTNTAGLGMLTLTAGSALSFAGASGTLVFGGFDPTNGGTGNFTLAVTGSNFGTATASADGTDDRLIFVAAGGLTTAQLNDITINGRGGVTETSLGGNFYEVLPAAVPEPSTWAAGLLLCGGLLGSALRRRRR